MYSTISDILRLIVGLNKFALTKLDNETFNVIDKRMRIRSVGIRPIPGEDAQVGDGVPAPGIRCELRVRLFAGAGCSVHRQADEGYSDA